MKESNPKIKLPSNTKRITEHRRLYLDGNSSDRQKAHGGGGPRHALLEKRLDHFFPITKTKNNRSVIKSVSTITTSIVHLNYTHTHICITSFSNIHLINKFFLISFSLTILTQSYLQIHSSDKITLQPITDSAIQKYSKKLEGKKEI